MGFESKGRSGVSNVSQTTLSAKTPGAAGSTVAERARAKRAADPVCIEMPVRVRGIGGLPIAGTSDMGQDFSEDTRTLIVMATGAVVRMATRVKKGQLLGLKHLSTGQEVSCRVVNVRSSGTPEDYVEVEFTQRAVGFWGIHFPNDPKDQPPTEEAPSPGEVEAERVIFGGGHTERGDVNVAPSTAGAAAQDAKAGTKAGGKADPKAENAPFADLVKPEPSKAAPVDSPGFSGLSKSAEEGAASAERVLRDDAVIQQQQAQRNVISFPSPTTHQEKANILAGPEETTLAAKLDFSPVIEEPAAKQAPSDAEIEHAAIARAIDEKAAREKTEAAARERAEEERKAAEVKAAKAAADKAAAERLAAAHAVERIEAEKRAEAERKAAEVKAAKAAAERAAAEKAAAEKAAAERLAAAQLELERKEAERRAAERMAAAERTRLFGEAQKKQEAERIAAERIAAEIAARDQATDDVEVAPSHDEKRRDTRAEGKAAPSETRRRSAAARPRRSLRMSIGATAHGTLEEEIQRDRAALKNTKTGHAFVIGGALAAVVLVLAVVGWWYMRGGAGAEIPQTPAPTTSLPSSGRMNTPASSAAIAPASAPNNAAATNSANPSASGANGTIAPGAAPVKPASAPPSANTAAARPSSDSKKPDSKKTANSKDDAALQAAAASELAKSASPNADKPADAPSKPVLKATLSAPVVVKRNSAAADVAAPDIEARPVSGADALPLGTVTSTSVVPATPRVGGHAVPPRLLKSALPEYPVLARQRHIEGDVVVQADIDANGNVKSVKAISGSELLRDAALNAVRQFKYSPAQLDDSPTTSQVLVTVKFRSK